MRIRHALFLMTAAMQLTGELPAQDARRVRESRAGYLRAVATHFRVSFGEVDVLSAWSLPDQETPVVLYLASRGGVSSDVVVSLRRDGLSWIELARRLGVGVGDFYLPMDAPDGSLSGAYALFERRPRDEWAGLRLSDADVVALVNLRVLSAELAVPPERILRSFDEVGDFVAVYGLLKGTSRRK